MDRRVQLRELYGLEFPDELFELWAWYQGLPAEMKATFVEHGGMRPHGVCDVLDGKFDGVELRYPAVLHWRYRLDPPEFVTVLTGDTDGLHWGFWFDDPKEPPVIVGSYARDAYEFWVAGTTLFGMVADQIEKSIEGCEENLEHDAKYAHLAPEAWHQDYHRLAFHVPSEPARVFEIVSPIPRCRSP